MKQTFALRQLITHRLWLWCFAWLLGIVTTWAILGLGMVSGWFITMSAAAGMVALGGHFFNYMLPAGIIRYFAIIRTLGRYGDLMMSHHLVFDLLKSLRVKFFGQWAKLDFAQRNQGSSSQKMHRLVKDIDVLNEFVLRVLSPWLMLIMALLAVGGAIFLILPSAVWSVAILSLMLVVAGVTHWLGLALATQESQLLEQRKSKLLDTMPALTQLILWHRWQDTVQAFAALDDTYVAVQRRTHLLRRMSLVLVQIIIILAVVSLLWLAKSALLTDVVPFTKQTLNNYPYLSPALVLAMVLGVFGINEFAQNLLAEPLALGRSLVAKTRLNELLMQPTAVVKTPLTATVGQAQLRIDDAIMKAPTANTPIATLNAVIDFAYPCLIQGVSGAGKSTLLHTLAGEYPLVGGRIQLVDSIQQQDWQQIDFAGQLGFLGQTVDIFDQTLADNLRLGKMNASDDELRAVLTQVGLGDWLSQQPKGLATPLGEYGMAVSGGQARRIALARLLLSPKQVLLLDEPFAGLDDATRQLLWQNLLYAKQQGNIGLLIISTHQRWQEMGDVQTLTIGV